QAVASSLVFPVQRAIAGACASTTTLAVTPSVAAPGDNVTVTWTTPNPQVNDFMALYLQSAPNSNTFTDAQGNPNWMFVTCDQNVRTAAAKASGTCTFPIPSNAAGNMNIRLFWAGSEHWKATSNTFAVTP